MPSAVHPKERKTKPKPRKEKKIINTPDSFLGKRRGSKLAHAESKDCLKISIEEAKSTSVGSAIQGLTERTATVDALSDALVCCMKNIQGWFLLCPDGRGTKNRLMHRLVYPFIILHVVFDVNYLQLLLNCVIIVHTCASIQNNHSSSKKNSLVQGWKKIVESE